MSLRLGRFVLMILFVCFKERRRITRGTERIFVVSSLGESVLEVKNVLTVTRCLRQESYPSRTSKTVTMGNKTNLFFIFFVFSLIIFIYYFDFGTVFFFSFFFFCILQCERSSSVEVTWEGW